MQILRYSLDRTIRQQHYPNLATAVQEAQRYYRNFHRRRFKFLEIFDAETKKTLLTKWGFYKNYARRMIAGECQIKCETCGRPAMVHIVDAKCATDWKSAGWKAADPTRHFCQSHAPPVEWPKDW